MSVTSTVLWLSVAFEGCIQVGSSLADSSVTSSYLKGTGLHLCFRLHFLLDLLYAKESIQACDGVGNPVTFSLLCLWLTDTGLCWPLLGSRVAFLL